jgi:uncharacterized protein (DUF2147 family)
MTAHLVPPLIQIIPRQAERSDARVCAMQLDGLLNPRQSPLHTLSYGRNTMKHALRLAIAASLLFAAGTALAAAADNTPAGTWKTIDDTTHKPKSIVVITENNGKYQATIKELLNRTPEDIAKEGDKPVCKECDGDRKNQPITGMNIMWGVTKDDDVWDGGKILDPKTGKIYKVKLKLMDNGQKLDVHGYIGFALLGRSQTWERQP